MRVNLTSTKPTLEERESKGKEEERANASAVARTTMSSSSSTETQTEWQTYWCHQCDLGVHLLVSISLSCPHCNLHTFLELMDSAAAASTSCAETNLLLHHFSNPCIKISPSMLAIDPSLICAVCREEFHVDAEANQLPCNHLFHPDCILPWLSSNNSCPLCRFRLTSI